MKSKKKEFKEASAFCFLPSHRKQYSFSLHVLIYLWRAALRDIRLQAVPSPDQS